MKEKVMNTFCSLSSPFRFQWLHLRRLSPYSGLVYCFWLVPCLHFPFSYFFTLYCKEGFSAILFQGKDFVLTLTLHTLSGEPHCAVYWSHPNEWLDHLFICDMGIIIPKLQTVTFGGNVCKWFRLGPGPVLVFNTYLLLVGALLVFH